MLRANTMASIFWSYITTWGEQIITFALLMILARILSPGEFGVVALAGLAIYVLQDIIRVTTSQTLVQMEDVTDTHFATIFWLIVIFAGVVSLALIASSSFLAWIFNEPLLAQITPWLSIVLICSSLEIVQEARLIRKQNFRPIAARTLSASSAGGIVAVTLALNGYGVWSIVAQQIVHGIVMVSVTWYFARWIPPFVFSWPHLKDAARVGRYISGTSVIEFIYLRIDIVFIGAMMGTQAVGLYNAGLRLLRILLNGICGALNRALFPALSRLQDNPERMRGAFLRSLQLSSVITIPVFIGLACVAPEAVHVLLGPQWAEAAPVVSILALAGAMQSFGWITSTAVLACGRARALFFIALAYGVVYFGAVAIGIQWGIVGVATAFLVTIYVMDNLHAIVLSKTINLRLRDIGLTLLPVLISTVIMATAILVAKQFLTLTSIVALPVYTAIGMAVYGTTLSVIAPVLRNEVIGAFGEILRRKPLVAND